MKIPLTMTTHFDNLGGKQELKIWSNGRRHIVTAPIMPYAYSRNRPLFPCIVSKITKKLLSNPYKEVELYKCRFGSTGDVGRYCSDTSIFLENHVQFVNRVMIDESKWIENFANTEQLKILSFDCEMESDGKTFPVPSRNTIVGIGWKFVEGVENVGKGGIDSPDIHTMWSENRKYDKDIIIKFLEIIKELDPDIIVGFNSNGFDLRYVKDRCVINNINFDKYIARSMDVKEPIAFIDKKNAASGKKYTEVRIEGRISYDLYYPVIRDQSMSGIKNRTMKIVAKWYKIKDVIEEDMSNVSRYLDTDKGRKKLDRYLRSDINITDKLFRIYFANALMLAEKLLIPLDDVVNATSSLLSNVIFGRELAAKNIVSDGAVIERYNKKHVANKRGGWVETYKKGFIKRLKKLDFKSYYPFLVVQFNISPETTFIIGYEDYQGELGYRFEWKDGKINGVEYVKWFYMSIPDRTLGKNVIVKINMSVEGFLPRYMKELFDERAALKVRMKEIISELGNKKAFENVEYTGLKSREVAVKIIINSFTGYVGNQHALYGNLSCYVVITGMGRYFIQKVINEYEHIIVSSDTDAIYTDELVEDDTVNRYVSKIVIKELGFKKCDIVMENEGNFGSAYFLDTKGKNYYIHDLDKDIVIKKGVATKRSSMAKIIDTNTDNIVISLLKDSMSIKNEELVKAVDKAYDISKWTITDIMQSVHVKKLSSYKKGTPLGLTIGILAQKRWKIPESQIDGMQLTYIKLVGKGNYAVASTSDDINDFNWDKEYYTDMLDKILKKLGLNDFHPSNKGSVITVQEDIEDAWN